MLNWVEFALISNYDDALASDKPAEGLKGLAMTCFNRNIARADSAPGSGNGSQMYFVNSWGRLGPWDVRLICKRREYLVDNIVHVLSIFKYCLLIRLICPN